VVVGVCAQVLASEVATRAANRAVQLFGGMGYVREAPVERLLRDARVLELELGPDQGARGALAATLLP
jgi:butyryl-CoA dehydrogenase